MDVGCYHGEFFRWLGDKIGPSVGLDPLYEHAKGLDGRHRFLKAAFEPKMQFPDQSFDVVSLLATIEHMQDTDAVAGEARRLLRAGGKAIITVPSVAVDRILDVLIRFRIIDGMSV